MGSSLINPVSSFAKSFKLFSCTHHVGTGYCTRGILYVIPGDNSSALQTVCCYQACQKTTNGYRYTSHWEQHAKFSTLHYMLVGYPQKNWLKFPTSYLSISSRSQHPMSLLSIYFELRRDWCKLPSKTQQLVQKHNSFSLQVCSLFQRPARFSFQNWIFTQCPFSCLLSNLNFKKTFRGLNFEGCFGVALLPGTAALPIVQPCMSLKGCHEGSEPS